MKRLIAVITTMAFLAGCSPSNKTVGANTGGQQQAKGKGKHFSIKLSIPDVFKQQATMQYVDGARGNKMSFANFSTSRIKRGAHLTSSGWGRLFFLENILWNQIGIQKNETVTQQRTRYRYTLTDGKNMLEVFAAEEKFSKALEFQILNTTSIFNSISRLQQSDYVFSAIIRQGGIQGARDWELTMTNVYDRRTDTSRGLFPAIKPGDDGLATNGQDTIFIKSLSIKQTALDNGKTGQLPFKLLAGYELSTSDGVIAVIDLIDRDMWFYNGLEDADKLTVSAIATAIFARTVYDAKW